MYKILRNPIENINELKNRKYIMDYFYENDDIRIEKQLELRKIGKLYHISLKDYEDYVHNKEYYSKWKHKVIPLLLTLSFTLFYISTVFGILFTILALFIVVYTYYQDKSKIEAYIPMIVQYGLMLNSIKKLSQKTGIEVIDQCTSKLIQGVSLNKKYKRKLSLIHTTIGGYTTELDTLMDYIRIITHMDLRAFLKIMEYINKNYKMIYECYETIGYLDSLLGLTIFKRQHELSREAVLCISTPEFIDKSETSLIIENAYYPLISSPVVNSVNIHKPILITGSNATGKSTFLRTIGLNAILAQTVYFVFAEKYSSSFYKVYTSINSKDNVYEADSYYMAEIKSIKRIMDGINNKTTVLCCLDEVLRGTNTIERIGASSEILQNFAEESILCIAATHDTELTYILEDTYENYHFQEKVTQDNIIFDFKLYQGRSYTRNAISLLRLLGYSEKIVSNAIYKVNNYIDTGKWVKGISSNNK